MNKIFLLIAFIGITHVNAQKLPAVQQASLRAPANVKVDGKPNEWGKLKAYNPALSCYYTIANDDKKLYVVLQAEGMVVANITSGGFKLVIQKTGYKKDAGAPFIKFPFREKGAGVLLGKREWIHPNADTVMMLDNKRLTANSKQIYTSGLFGADTVISMYNESGVEAGNTFDINRIYTCELSIDLSLLGLSVQNAGKFAYHIVENGEPYKYVSDIDVAARPIFTNNFKDAQLTPDKLNYILENLKMGADRLYATSDFWGEYILAK